MTDEYRILCAVDGSAGSNTALDLVGSLPLRAQDRVIVGSRPAYFFAVRPGDDGPFAQLAAQARAAAREHVDAAIARLAGHGVEAKSVSCDAGEDTVDAILRCVEDVRPSLLVVGSRGRGPWSSILIGSTARALAILSPVPVLVARTARLPLRVLVAVDGSPAARAALTAFAGMPQSEGSVVELFHVLPAHEWSRPAGSDPVWPEMNRRTDVERDEEQRGLEVLAREQAVLPRGIASRVSQERGHVGQRILARAAALDADLVVLGTQGLGGRRQLFFGSTAERVLVQAPANVLIGGAPAAD